MISRRAVSGLEMSTLNIPFYFERAVTLFPTATRGRTKCSGRLSEQLKIRQEGGMSRRRRCTAVVRHKGAPRAPVMFWADNLNCVYDTGKARIRINSTRIPGDH